MKVAVIGGGISGLSSAFLIKKNLGNVEVDVFEKGELPGGTIKTVYKDQVNEIELKRELADQTFSLSELEI